MSVEVISHIGTVASTFLYGAPFYMSGRVLYVATDGDDGDSGLTYVLPKRTLGQAVLASTDYRTDVIVLKSGFRQTLTADVDITNVRDGLLIVSEGVGSDRGIITGNGWSVNFTGNDQRMMGTGFVCSGAAAIAGLLGTTAVRFAIENCDFVTPTLTVPGCWLGAGANVRSCIFTSGVEGSEPGLIINGPVNGLTMENCTFDGGSTGWASDVACVIGNASTVIGFLINGSVLANRSRIRIDGGSKGVVRFDDPSDIGIGSGVDWTF